MARKGNYPKNGADRSATKSKHKFSGILDPLSSDTTAKSQPNEEKMVEGEGPMNGNLNERSLSPLRNNVKGRKPSGSSRKNGKVGDDNVRDKSEIKNPTLVESGPSLIKVKDANPICASDNFDEHFGISDSHNHVSRNFNGFHNGEVQDGLMDEPRPFVKLALKHLSLLASHLLHQVNVWVEKQKPLVNSFSTVMADARNYIEIKINYTYPIIRSWILQLGKILFLFLMVWLDCSFRGLSSLFHLGTTSFFTIIWCSFFSILAMIGITKMLIVVVTAGLVAVFVGLGIAILMVLVSSAVILWFYGSFWTTMLIVILGGVSFGLSHERIALFLTTVYSIYSANCYMGWFGLFMGLNLSFISSDVLINFLRNTRGNQGFNIPSEQSTSSQGRESHFYESMHASSADNSSNSSFERSGEHDAGETSTSGNSAELTSEEEVVRLLNCSDHYSALGFARYENIDISSLKREYRKKAMLVHPDKNMGNEKAAEAFKKLQNAYEVLLDSLKRKTYDDELRREEILNFFRKFQNIPRKNGSSGTFNPGYPRERGSDGPPGESRRIACKKCGDFHIWIHVNRPKSQARWCQDCKDFHHAKDGDGWVEQSFQPLMFGMLHKMDPPHAYVCADSKIYDATEWFDCQGMRCPANSHKATFHINTSITSLKHNAKGTHSSGGAATKGFPGTNMDETMTEEEFFEWLQNAVQSGIFDADGGASTESPTAKTGNFTKNGSKKKRKGKKPW